MDLNGMDLQINRIEETFDSRYAVCGKLGRGAMGSAFLIKERNADNAKYALKAIEKNQLQSECIDTFEIAQHLIKLRHPSIIAIYEAREDAEYIYIRQEFIEGRTLAEIRDDKSAASSLQNTAVKAWMKEIASAIFYLHENGVLHRDIKPGNIMVDRDGLARLIDFGSARRIASISRKRTTSTIGSAPYSPLERLQGKPDGISTDIYGYGMSFYSLITGKVPQIKAEEINSLRTAGKRIKPYFMKEYNKVITDINNIGDPEIRNLLDSCLTLDHRKRTRKYNKLYAYKEKNIDEQSEQQ